MTPTTAEVVARWVEKAEHDLLTAEHTLTLPADRCPYDTVAFHAQQCAEKYLKALLVAQNIDVPKTHDLALLVSRLVASGQRTSDVTPAMIDQLNPFAVVVRYPDDLGDVERADAEGAFGVCQGGANGGAYCLAKCGFDRSRLRVGGSADAPRFDPVLYGRTPREHWQVAAEPWHRGGATLDRWLGEATTVMLGLASPGSAHL